MDILERKRKKMKDTVTLKELAAIVLRRGKLAVILALAAALLLGGWRAAGLAVKANSDKYSPEKIEERYQEALESYEEGKADLEEQLSRAQAQLESQREYNENSILMEIDPHNKAVTTINLAITDVDEGAFQQVFRLESTPIDFIISKIQNQYIVLWNSLDLQDSLSYKPRAGMEDKYLREIVTLNKADGGCLALTVAGTSEQETRKLAEAAYSCLKELQAVISEGSYLHSFAELSDVTKISVDDSLESTQTSNLEKVTNYTDSIDELAAKLEELKEPEREHGDSPAEIAMSAVKYAVLGAALGLILALVWDLLSYLFRNRVETSRQLEQGLSIPFLGSVAKRGGVWNRMADWVLGERLWPDEARALDYIAGSAGTLLPPSGGVLLASTLPLEEAEVQAVVKALQAGGRAVGFVGDAGRDPRTAEALKACGCLVLAERPGATRWDTVMELAALARSLDKPVGGFITV